MEEAAIEKLLIAATVVCRRKGYNVDADLEYQSAINWGVFKAVQTHSVGRSIESYAILIALHECESVRRRLERDALCDQAGASRGMGAPPVATPIPLTDFEILSFVAARGITQAARLLFGGPKTTAWRKMRTILDEIALRVRREPWRLQEEWRAGNGEESDEPGATESCSFSEGVPPLGTRGARRRSYHNGRE